MVKILKPAFIPTTQIKPDGSVKGRYKYAQTLMTEFYNTIKDEFGTHDVSLEKVKKAYLKVLPPHKRLEIHKLPQGAPNDGSVYIGMNKKRNIEGYIVNLKPNYYGIVQGLGLQEFGTLMHETDHLFSYFTNPKYVKRIIIMCENGYRDKKYFKFFDNELQSVKKQNRNDLKTVLYKKLEKYFKNKSAAQKINTLQDFRYRLINERNAYKTGNTYQALIEDYHPGILSQKTAPVQVNRFYIDEKIEVISNMLKNVIRAEREKLKHT
ncbi:TPA: hypothetical protein IAC10_14125 [Candidatus Scatousia excrementigallinarum]|uniref:Uncharacterized protein n=1 Tax=Candidatus Scatousia excrementigallinarum TaxID=2840935 RepID=A0A9D1F1A5_9BACT|nr:hypothetical protein [Candidatus Scatousia excrementigallinarum]